ncbi:unnamed protein product [Rhizoctonia solani]|uniref:Nephrocystin 3-like N-terminal domain-containing protein n=1 Tax=Rhizoctonia solani TaxID=456999 RepID=A0A8H3H016_9AGAM|nr:unnamed protein product [Rhizoctonia solani]
MYFLKLLNFKGNKRVRHPSQPLAPFTPSNTTGIRPQKTTWAGLTAFLDLLNKSVGAVGPLKSAVGELVECIGICNKIARGRREYEDLSSELDNLFGELKEYYELCGQTLWTQSTAAEIQRVSDEVKLIIESVLQRRGRSHTQTYVRAEEDVQDIMECYRRIHSIFQKLQRILSKSTIQLLINGLKLAQVSPEFALELSRVLELNTDSQLQGLEAQFQKLLLSPLGSASKGLPLDLVVVIDALDECEDPEGAGFLIDMILAQPNLPIKFLITSRPEPAIRASLENSSAHFEVCHLHNLDETTVKGDIRIYLKDELRHMPTPLTNVQLDSLVERSNTLFIFAATAVRYIQSRNFSMNPEKRLALVLDASTTTSELKDAEISKLYMKIVDSAFADPALEEWDIDDRKRVLHAVICAQQPLTILALADLLEMTPKRVGDALDTLWSVLSVPSAGSNESFVTVLHTSFRDFIFSCPDSKIFHCDQKQHHQKLARRCIKMIRDTRPSFNICALESSYILDDEDSRLPERIKKAISPGLLYACLNWIAHLEIAGGPEDWDQFSDFFSSSLLLWMEILTLTRCIGLGPRIMWRAQQLSKVHPVYNSQIVWILTSMIA